MTVTVLYFAALRDAAGVTEEVVPTPVDLPTLYAALQARHGFTFPSEALRVAVDGEFRGWSHPVRDGSEIAFIPPVSGG